MKFENKANFKEIKLTSLNTNLRLTAFALAISISTSLFAGSEIVRASDDIYFGGANRNYESSDEDYIEIPDIYKQKIGEILNKDPEFITKKDLSRFKNFNLTISDDSDISWLKYLNNMEKLNVIVKGDVDSDDLNKLEVLGEMENFKELYLGTIKNLSLTKDKTTFLYKIQNMRSLTIDGFSVEEGVLEKLTNLEDPYGYEPNENYYDVINIPEYVEIADLNCVGGKSKVK